MKTTRRGTCVLLYSVTVLLRYDAVNVLNKISKISSAKEYPQVSDRLDETNREYPARCYGVIWNNYINNFDDDDDDDDDDTTTTTTINNNYYNYNNIVP
jgi:hypothetical protein